MGSLNMVQLIGYLGKDPEMRYLPDGTPVANVSIATNEKWTDKAGHKQEKTEWHRVVFFGRQAEIVGEYLKKGSQAYVQGKLQTHKWEDKDKVTRYSTEVHAFQLQMLGESTGKRQTEDRAAAPPTQPPRRPASAQDYRDASRGEAREATVQERRTLAGLEDDIPF